MKVPVLTAVVDARWEAGIVAAFDRPEHGIAVERRCVDLADLLATAATGTARAVLLSADLRRLDRDALTRLALARIAVVGLFPPGDEHAERRLRQLGVTHVLAADAAPEVISQAVADAVALVETGGPPSTQYADPLAALPMSGQAPAVREALPGTGRLIAVWGPTGAPGRTTVAVNLAAELAGNGMSALLVDADVYGGVVAQTLGLLDEAPGLAAAARLANGGNLDVPALAQLARVVLPGMRVLTGISRADRWPELRPSALEVVFALARSLADVVVVDCGFSLEQDEELSYDTAAPRRNGATLAVIDSADTVVAVAAADPVGLQRFVRGLAELREVAAGVEPVVVVNKLRGAVVPGDASAEIETALRRYAGVEQFHALPYDRNALDAALAAGKTLREAAPRSALRHSLETFARGLTGVPAVARGRRLRSGRRVVG